MMAWFNRFIRLGNESRRPYKLGQRLKYWFENYPIWVLLGIFAFIMGGILSTNGVSALITIYYREHIAWRQVEQDKISRLAPSETIPYVNSVLGEPIEKKPPSNSKDHPLYEYIYKERGYWVDAYSDDSNTVAMMVITACGIDDFYPVIGNNPVGEAVTLGKTTMDYVASFYDSNNNYKLQPSKRDYTPHYHTNGFYFLSTTTPTYFYDEYHPDDPDYRTVYAGVNSACGEQPSLITSLGLDFEEVNQATVASSKFDKLRSKLIVNTFAVVSPYYKDKIFDETSYEIGISRIDMKTLNAPWYISRW